MRTSKKIVTMFRGGGGADPYPGVTVYDTFADANGTNLTVHTPDKAPEGAAWTALSGVMQISSNRAAWVSGAPQIHYLNTGKADATITLLAKMVGPGPNAGIAFRVEGVNDWLMATISTTTVYLIKRNPSLVVVGSKAQARLAGVEYALEVTFTGGNISFRIDGVEELTATDTHNAAITNHGLYTDGTAGANYDNFQVV